MLDDRSVGCQVSEKNAYASLFRNRVVPRSNDLVVEHFSVFNPVSKGRSRDGEAVEMKQVVDSP